MLFRLLARAPIRPAAFARASPRLLQPGVVRFYEPQEFDEQDIDTHDPARGGDDDELGSEQEDMAGGIAGPMTDSEGDDSTGLRIMQIRDELERPENKIDDWDEDRRDVARELEFRLENLKELDTILSPEWVPNHDNGTYYNPGTGEVKMPYEISYDAYKERRAARFRNRMADDVNSRVPDFMTPRPFSENQQLYDEPTMRRVRDKYKFIDFKALHKRLAETDSAFFAFPAMPNIAPWGAEIPNPQHTEAENAWEVENIKFLSLLPVKWHLRTYRVWHMTPVGKKWSYGVLVVGGTGKGWAGFGYGKGATSGEALKAACKHLRNNMMDVPLDEGRTIPNSIVGKYKKTRVIMMRCTRGRGIKAAKLMRCVLECFGIDDCTTKVVGSKNKNPLSVVAAAFEGLSRLRSPREKAMFLGVNFYRDNDAPFREPAPTPQEAKHRQDQITKHIQSAAELWQERTDLHEKRTTAPNPNYRPTEEGKRVRTKTLYGKYAEFKAGKPTNPKRPGWMV